ncbi:MAG: hypothetical protein WA374_10570, partial [Acidobacteriaceae bacterium]
MIESDAQLEQALSAALAREAAPDSLIAGLEQRLTSAEYLPKVPQGAPSFVPTFACLQITTKSRWTSLLSLGTHAVLCLLIVLLALNRWHTRQMQKKLIATTVDVAPFIPSSPLKDT